MNFSQILFPPPKNVNELLFLTTIIVDENGGCGTGFFASWPLDGSDLGLTFLVTNKHVIEGVKTVTIYLHDEVDPFNISHPIKLNIDGKVKYHPDDSVDLCIISLFGTVVDKNLEGVRFFARSLPIESFIKNDAFKHVLITEDVLMIGYPIGLRDEKHNIPILRKGCFAMHPYINYEDNNEFLIDIPAFVGSSGSPVIIIDGGLFRLAGIVFASPDYKESGEIVINKIAKKVKMTTEITIPVNIAICAKAHELLKIDIYT